MKSCKKRFVSALIASIISIGGVFASGSFKNSLKAITFSNSEDGTIKMSVMTEKPCSNTPSLVKKDNSTYIMLVPETNNGAPTPNISEFTNNISSVNINTIPYTANGKGYTRIVIKTDGTSSISAETKLYEVTPEMENELEQKRQAKLERQRKELETQQYEMIQQEKRKQAERARRAEQINEDSEKEVNAPTTNSKPTSKKFAKKTTLQEESQEPIEADVTPVNYDNYETNSSSDTEGLMLILGIILIFALSAFLYTRAKNKMTDLAGEKIDIDLGDEHKDPKTNENTSQKEVKTIKTTVQTLDKKYQQPSQPIKTISEENSNIVDLDELFQESKTNSQEDDENIALEEFLNGFSFDEEFAKQEAEAENELVFNEELFNSIIENKKIKFSSDDVKRMDKLLSSEINDDTIKNITDYLVSNPITKKPSIEKILENFVTTISVGNNVTFSKEDINALQKIISVEFDTDFVSNLRTDPERTKQMENELRTYHKDVRKPSKIKTLNVKRELPDLSKISSKKPLTDNKPSLRNIDYSKDCEVSTLDVDINIDFSEATNTYEQKPKEKIVENNWETSTLKIADMLPDLNDALLHPEKYKKPEPEKFIADENVLLERLSNLSFKPIDDGSNNFEILNKPEELDDFVEEERQKLSPEEVQLELKKLLELEQLGVPKETKTKAKENIVPNPPKAKNQIPNNKTEQVITNNAPTTKLALDNQAYNIISSVNFSETQGCHLAKNENGYILLGFVKNNLFKIKEYTELKSEKIQARLNENLPNGHNRYLVRIGLNKLIIDVSETEIKYVLDLC